MADQGGLKRTDADQFGPKTAQKWMYALCFKPEPDSVKSVCPPFLVSRADLSARVYLAHLSALFWSAASDIHPWKNISCAQASRSGRVLTYVIAYRSNGHYMPSTRSSNKQVSEGKESVLFEINSGLVRLFKKQGGLVRLVYWSALLKCWKISILVN